MSLRKELENRLAESEERLHLLTQVVDLQHQQLRLITVRAAEQGKILKLLLTRSDHLAELMSHRN